MIDSIARDAIANDLDSTLLVEAAAGTGKTTELVRRILRILAVLLDHAKAALIQQSPQRAAVKTPAMESPEEPDRLREALL